MPGSIQGDSFRACDNYESRTTTAYANGHRIREEKILVGANSQMDEEADDDDEREDTS